MKRILQCVLLGMFSWQLSLAAETSRMEIPTVTANPSAQTPITPPEDQYQIELIVYTQLSAQALASENWGSLNPLIFDSSSVYELTSEAADNSYIQRNYNLLPDSQHQLSDIVKSLLKKHYEIIKHFAWVMDKPDLEKGKTLHLFGGVAYAENGDVLDEGTALALEYSTTPFWQLDGLMKIRLRRYFDLHLNLRYTASVNQIRSIDSEFSADNSSPLVTFSLLQSRRMRSNELNYIGHPVFGVLIKIIKLDPRVAPENDRKLGPPVKLQDEGKTKDMGAKLET